MRDVTGLMALVAAAALTGCADPVAPAPESTTVAAVPLAVAGAETIPISFVTQFADFLGGEGRENGTSGRTQSHFCLAFTVQEGDLEGTLVTCFSANDPSDQTASQGINGWFTSTVPDYSHYEVCMPSRGLCGTFDEATSVGKVYPLPRGAQFPNSVAFGGGDFDGMKLQGSIVECEDSNGDRGCFSGTLLAPGKP
jgi:hypothetical protein